MGYRLKPEYPAFSPVQGQCAGGRFEHEYEYDVVPFTDLDKFVSSGSPSDERGEESKGAEE
jgi:hypothetical protein